MTWILIMTLYSDALRKSYATVATAEFNTQEACINAGKQQENVLMNEMKINTNKKYVLYNYTFVCVPKG